MTRDNSNASPHALVPSVSSPEAFRHPGRKMRHAPVAVIRLSLSIVLRFPKQRPSGCRLSANSSPSRSPSRLIPSRRASRPYIGLFAHAVFVIPFRRVLLVGSCSSRSHLRASHMTSPSPRPHHHIHITNISIVFSYPCILVSFIYIAYIIFIIYINRRDLMSHAPIAKQPAVPPPVPSFLIGIAERGESEMAGSRRQRAGRERPARPPPCPVAI